ncbi:MAG: cytochrome ubiquinol oxidase subunit I [Planctomycetia bacterium]|nr:cytochrome ubiquinol oxidase subunit I [Planctomycetia bacterium]
MHYPWWYVPGLTSPMIIAVVAIFHVIVSHYAVGGGILLARENAFAIKKKENNYRAYWKKHSQFFVLLTVVYGAITGVGIWWTIGLSSPLATELLIRTFLFGWAIEWAFFVVEIVAAFAFYYYWDRLPGKDHARIGWIYALAAWISLVLITGITSFMLNSASLLAPPGSDRLESFWKAFLNMQFIPQTIARTGGALVLSTFYVYFHAAWSEKNDNVREKVVQRMRLPSLIGILLMIAAIPLWYFWLPQSSKMMLESAAALNIFLVLFFAICGAAMFLILIGPVRAPKKVSTGFAIALLLFGFAAVSTGEFIREAIRKPFIVDQLVYGNQIQTNEVEKIRKKGILASGYWTRIHMEKLQKKYPKLKIVESITAESSPIVPGRILPVQYSAPQSGAAQFREISNKDGVEPIPLGQNPVFKPASTENGSGLVPAAPPSLPKAANPTAPEKEEKPANKASSRGVLPIDNTIQQGNPSLLKISEEDRIDLGKTIFLYHCNDCHSTKHGYAAVGPLLTGRTNEEIRNLVLNLNRPGFYMPPWCGNQVEAELLTQYLASIRPEIPENILGTDKLEKKKEDPAPKESNPGTP